ncbi:MAG: SRPBCC family protein [Xanthobacteraceae bacterium]|nr:SRPBCC family protein [Xanthobacteraceae bacterium]
MTTSPEPTSLIKAPLRNRLRLELTAPVAEVWSLVGDPARMPDYSAGLGRVEAKTDALGRCTEFTCYFKPTGPGEDGIVSRDTMLWYQPNRGWASCSAAHDAFGMIDDLHLVVLEPSTDGTLLTWDAYYQAQDLAMMKAHLHAAQSDIGANLVKRFGGRQIHCYVCD